MACMSCCCTLSHTEEDMQLVSARPIFESSRRKKDTNGRDTNLGERKNIEDNILNEPLEPLEEFTASLDMSAGRPVGIGVVMASKANMLKVAIVQGNGAVSQWNADNPHMKIEVGDYITKVNNTTGNVHSMLRACTSGQSMMLSVKKP
mmetsp:Transcript_13804/g.37804  ORF Transcript_13804/g.37804 Transcript_13804/m.37804 type:complete len:148 (-) Transcript_13804:135-578(-)